MSGRSCAPGCRCGRHRPPTPAQKAQHLAGWATANRRRTETAARRQVAQARIAFRTLWKQAPTTRCGQRVREQNLDALGARIRYPRASLAQIAQELGVTKDTYSARLRRALDQGRRLERQQRRAEAAS